MARSPRDADASDPVLVHQPTASFHPSSRRSVTLPPLGFPSLVVTYSGEDFHLLISAHAGHTTYFNCGAKPRQLQVLVRPCVAISGLLTKWLQRIVDDRLEISWAPL